MRLRLHTYLERLRASLFVIPTLAVIAAVAIGICTLAADARLEMTGGDVPLGFASTVDSARALLSTIAAATISFAGIAFSVSLLTIQQASNQHSPRVVPTLFRDGFNKRVMGLVVGTFTYCVIVLRSVRSAIDDGGQPIIPNLSVAVAVVLGIATILAVIGFIDHSAHAMDVSVILDRVRSEAVSTIQREWSEEPSKRVAAPSGVLPQPSFEVRFDTEGWVQQIDVTALLRCLPDGTTMELATFAGRYAVPGTPLCSISPVPDEEEREDVVEAIRAAIVTGSSRTLQQDVSYGLRQLADVALKALSPGINDPTTAQDAIFHLTAVLAVLLHLEPPVHGRPDDCGRRLLVPQQPDHAELIGLAFDEVRRASSDLPAVSVYLLESLHLLDESLVASGREDRTTALRAQARRIVDGSAAADLLPADRHDVEVAYAKRFAGT